MTESSGSRPGARLLARFLSLSGIVVLGLSLFILYVGRILLRDDTFAQRVSDSLDDPRVGEFVALKITDAVIKQQPDLTALRPILVVVTRSVVTSAPFRAMLRPAARKAHAALLSPTTKNVLLAIPDARVLISNALKSTGASGDRLPPRLAPVMEMRRSTPILRAVAATIHAARAARAFGRIGFAVALVLFVGAVAIAPQRRSTLLSIGVGVATVGALLALSVPAGKVLAGATITDPMAAAAATGLWEAFVGPLRLAGGVVGLIGAVIALVAVPRVGVDPRAAGARVWAALTHRQATTGAEVGRLVGIGLVGLVALLAPSLAMSIGTVVGGVALVLVSLMGVRQLVHPARPAGAQATTEDVRLGPVAMVGARIIVFLALGVTAASVLLGLRPRAEVVHAANNACNGAVELCSRPFNKIVFPGAHNAMGAATNPNWLFPNQDLDVAKLLDRGVRAFLLDPYRGFRMGERVKTDFDAVAHANQKIESVIGNEAWQAGMRIRERLTGEQGPPSMYFCHGFCELGAIPMEQTLRVFVDFLATHPDEVIILSFEDYAPPADIAAVIESSGLIDYVYQGPLGPTWPTLGEMIAGGGRVVMMGDVDTGNIPWYHHSLGGLVTETPYTFHKPQDFNCRPNRGTPTGDLFLINHWIETTPAPRPSNAEIVNQREALVRRARQCERDRHMLPTIFAVDFAGIGDIVGAARELNGLPPLPPPTN